MRSVWAILIAVTTLAVAAPASAQVAPRIEKCIEPLYLELKSAGDYRTPRQDSIFRMLDEECTDALIEYHRTMRNIPQQYNRFEGANYQQNVLPHPNKLPAEALLWSAIIPGGGQFYNGELGKGAAFLLTNIAGWTGILYGDQHSENWAAYLGLGLVVGSYWGSLFDGVRTAGGK